MSSVLGDNKDDKKKAYYRSLPRVNFFKADAKDSDVIYTLFKNSSPTEGQIVNKDTSNSIIKEKDIPTVLIMHGWTTDDTSPWYRPLRDEYFKQGSHNIIFLNWSKAGNNTYQVSSANCKPVGKFIAQFLIASKVNLSKVHLIGHSLGSQLSCYIGQFVEELSGRKVGRITALDPAGPMWMRQDMSERERLSYHDADFVDVIHTDIQFSGVTTPIGHVDFYPNEGKHQPGCPSREEDSNCSHARSTLYFIESVATKAIAREAIFMEDAHFSVTVTPKLDGKEIVFGQHVDKSARGVYYIKTNAVKPFLIKP
ncbi:lipase member H-A-like isoform X2 [Diabrotica virgifera virgifera]|uniref:Lipase domain-containing protein n=1 Tax=Diabrotica virgifera virgifera TaxID=50390 RepID=A0ABM5IVR7_DIAVI|nr:lipase member H-A-like isoform X2 [Diabrotica virgifera virgifera]